MCGGALDAPVPRNLPIGFPCHACGEILHSTLRLIAHSVKHTGIKPFFCPLCPRNFTRRERLHAHVEAFHQAPDLPKLGANQDCAAKTDAEEEDGEPDA